MMWAVTAMPALACEAMRGSEYQDPPETLRTELSASRWHVARRTWTDAYARKEWVPPEETLAAWTRLVTWDVAFGHEETDLVEAQRKFLSALAAPCESHHHESLQTNPRDVMFEWWDDGCFGRPQQHQIVRLVRGVTGVHTVSATAKGARFDAEERATWIGRIASMPLVMRADAGSEGPLGEVRTWIWSGAYDRAVERLMPLAKADDAAAQGLLGQLYVEGWGVEQDYARARQLLESARANGNRRAAFDLGQLYEQALGVDADPKRALELYREAAEGGLAEAQGRVGYLLLNGPPSLADPAASYRWFELALSNGHTHARYWLGRLHESGVGATRDVLRAAELYTQSAREGEPEAQYRLGLLYATGRGVAVDAERAKLWLMRAAGQGNESARSYYKSLTSPADS